MKPLENQMSGKTTAMSAWGKLKIVFKVISLVDPVFFIFELFTL
jgi:hypothetical protein